MKRLLFLSAAMSALVGPAFADDLTISSAALGPLATATAANSSPGNITITAAGSVTYAAATPTLTLNSGTSGAPTSIVNNGSISNTVGFGGVGVSLVGGSYGSLINNGNITVAGSDSTSGQVGISLTGTGALTGNIVNGAASKLTVAGTGAGGIYSETELNGNLTMGGTILVTGPATNAVLMKGAIDGAVTNTGNITVVSGGTSTTTLNPNAGSALALGGSVGGGIFNSGNMSTVGTIPAFYVAPALGGDAADLTVGLFVDGLNPGYSILNRGNITGTGNQPSISPVTVQVGNVGSGGKSTILTGGIYNNGLIAASATSDTGNATSFGPAASNALAIEIAGHATIGAPGFTNDLHGNISATTAGPMGGTATALQIDGTGNLTALANAGIISANATTTDTTIGALTAYAINDTSGTLTTIVNSGTLSATATAIQSHNQVTVAADLSKASAPITFTDSGIVAGDIRFGSSAVNTLTIEGPNASVSGMITTASTGRVGISVSNLGTGGSLTTGGSIKATTLTMGANSTLDLGIGANTTVISAAGAGTFNATSHVLIRPTALVPNDGDITLVHAAGGLTFGAAPGDFGNITSTISVPFLYHGTVSHTANDLIVTLTKKTAAELGLTGNLATIYGPAYQAGLTDTPIGVALSGLTSNDQVSNAISQLLPLGDAAATAMADGLSDPSHNNIAARQTVLLLAPGTAAKFAPWSYLYHGTLNDTGVDSYDGKGSGMTVGVDYSQANKGHIGVAATMYYGSADDTGGRGAASAANWFILSPYVGFRSPDFFLNAQFNAGTGILRQSRTASVGGINRTASSKLNEQLASGGVTGGAIIDIDGFKIMPQIALNGMYLNHGDYIETGGGNGVDLQVAGRSITEFRAFVGVGGGGAYDVLGGTLTPEFLGGWSRQIVSSDPAIRFNFVSVPGFATAVSGPTLSSSKFVGSAGMDYAIEGWSLGLRYDAAADTNAFAQSANVTLGAQF